MEYKNAIIEKFEIKLDADGDLSVFVHLDYGGIYQKFGYDQLYISKKHYGTEVDSVGYFISNVMKVAGVNDIDNLVGKSIEVKCDHGKVYEIKHIIKKDLVFALSLRSPF